MSKWIYQSGQIITHDENGDPYHVFGRYCPLDEKLSRRIVEEHNALASVPDVAGYVAKVQEVFGKLNEAYNSVEETDLAEQFFDEVGDVLNETPIAFFPTAEQKQDTTPEKEGA